MLPELAQVPCARVAKNRDDLAALGQSCGRNNRRDTVDGAAAACKDTVVLHQPPGHAARLLVRNLDRVVDQLPARLEVLRYPVDADSLHDRVDLLPPPRPLLLRAGIHDAVSDLVIQPAALGICENDLQTRYIGLLLQVLGHARNRTARPRAGHKGAQLAAGLVHDLGARSVQMRGEVGRVLELVRKVAYAAVAGLGGVLHGAPSRKVDKVLRRRDRRRIHALDRCAEMAEQIDLFHGHVVGHADVRAVASRARQCRQRDARATDGALVDGVPAPGNELARGLGGLDHGERDAVLGRVARGVEELGLGQDHAPRRLA
ncbi:transcription elongation factor S-II, partial [Colletotrichum tofieldiae]